MDRGNLGSERPGAPHGRVPAPSGGAGASGGPAPSLCTTSEMFNLKSSCRIPWEEVICMTKNTNQLGRCEAHLFLKY